MQPRFACRSCKWPCLSLSTMNQQAAESCSYKSSSVLVTPNQPCFPTRVLAEHWECTDTNPKHVPKILREKWHFSLLSWFLFLHVYWESPRRHSGNYCRQNKEPPVPAVLTQQVTVSEAFTAPALSASSWPGHCPNSPCHSSGWPSERQFQEGKTSASSLTRAVKFSKHICNFPKYPNLCVSNDLRRELGKKLI